MATTTYLSNPTLTVNAVDLQDQCRSASLARAGQGAIGGHGQRAAGV